MDIHTLAQAWLDVNLTKRITIESPAQARETALTGLKKYLSDHRIGNKELEAEGVDLETMVEMHDNKVNG